MIKPTVSSLPRTKPVIEAVYSKERQHFPVSKSAQILFYSHDTYGLGHIRRNRKIAGALVEKFPNITATLITGSDIAQRFGGHPRIDYVQIPQIEKLHDGSYQPKNSLRSYEQVIEERKHAILESIKTRQADIFIADKEPLGLGGELGPAINYLKTHGTSLILGLRDVLDDPAVLQREWVRKGIFERIEGLYDHIWIYGSQDFNNPLNDIDLPASVISACTFTGFIYRPRPVFEPGSVPEVPDRYLLVTAGGGGDGNFLMNAVLDAYERDPTIPCPAVLLLGPLSDPEHARIIHERAARMGRTRVIDFAPEPEVLIKKAEAVVGMCGYNTFCEVVSRHKRVLFVPRQTPRMEQYIRARRATELGYCDMIDEKAAADPARLASSIKSLLQRRKQRVFANPFDSSGLDRIGDLLEAVLRERNAVPAELVQAGK